MSSTQAVNMPILPDWVQQHIHTLYAAKTDEDFNRAFDAFIAERARITFNGHTISREEYKKTIRGETRGDASATVNFSEVVSAPSKSDDRVSAVRFHQD